MKRWRLRKRSLAEVVGVDMSQRLSVRVQQLLLQSYATTAKRTIGRLAEEVWVHVEDEYGSAAARLLCIRGWFRQNLSEPFPAEVQGKYVLTDAGRRVVVKLLKARP